MILLFLCAPLSLTSYLTCRVISPLAPLSSSLPCARHLPLLSPLLPLLRSLARLRLPSPLTSHLPTSLVSSLRLPLPRCLPRFLLLLFLPLPSLLLLASFWLPHSSVFGRLAGPWLFPVGDHSGEGLPSSPLCRPRHSDQLSQELSSTCPALGLSRDDPPVNTFEGFPNSGQDSQGALSRPPRQSSLSVFGAPSSG